MPRLMTSACLCGLLIAAPLSASFADDEETQILHNNGYQEALTVSCGSYTCSVNFPPTTHATTQITALNCGYEVPSGTQTLYAYLSVGGSQARFNVPAFVTGSSGYDWFVGINAQVNLFVTKGNTPYFYINTSGATPVNLTCTVSGYHS